MDLPRSLGLRRERKPSPRPRPPGGAMRRVARRALHLQAVVALVLGLGFGLLVIRLSQGPLSVSGLPDRVAQALADRIGPGWTVTLRDSAIELDGWSLALRTSGLDIRNPKGLLVVRAPDAVVAVDTLSLLTATLQPRAIELRDLQLRAMLGPDGSVSFVPVAEPAVEAQGPGQEPSPISAPAAPAADAPPGSRFSAALSSLFDLVLERTGIVGALDRARVVNARLAIVDTSLRERAVFERFNASFERDGDAGRRFDLRLDGPRGAWNMAGSVRAKGDARDGALVATEIPIQDLLLLGGQSALPGDTDLKLSARADVAVREGRVQRFETQLETGSGTLRLHDQDMPPIHVDRTLADASWDEERRVLTLRSLAYQGGGTRVSLAGRLVARADAAPEITLTGANAVLSGATAGDEPVRLDQVALTASLRDEGLVLDRLALKGPEIDATLSGSVGTAADQQGLRLALTSVRTGVRQALRVWPEPVAPPVRRYLAENLRAGRLDLTLAAALTGADLRRAVQGGDIPDQSLKIDFAIADATLVYGRGLPPLTGTSVSGAITGRRARVSAPGGRVQMPDERALAVSGGSFVVEDFWPDDATARIGFRVEGGADALGSFLRSPGLRGLSQIDLDPGALKGRADLKVAIPLAINNLPALEDLPVQASGTLADLSIERVFGKERLEGASLAVAYERGGLLIRGEGRLAGSPAQIEVRQPRGGPGEAAVVMSLDEAARARKGMSFGPQLAGPVGVRAVLPLGAGAKSGTRVEADLTKASVDNLLPGWVKPAGRPGRLTFLMSEGPTTELRDLHLEAGPVQIKGSATLAADGSLERAEATQLRLSPNDDLRAQVERAAGVYKVTVRGNLVDARPFAKALAAPSSAPSRRAPAASREEGRDLDLDLGVNILTGFNDEALTNVQAKAATRGGSLRQLQAQGRFGGRPVAVRTLARPGLGPVAELDSEDAGATLRFLDIYRRMGGGDLRLQVSMADGPQRGTVEVTGFQLRNEPALRRILPAQTQAAGDEGGRLPAINTNEVAFTRLKADFIRTASRVEFRDAVIAGQQLGFTLGGWIDYGRDRADISGTFVPLYGLNNVFAQVPLFGPILGGGRNEGLFGVNFRVAGAASAPTLTVNPLSAIAPGFLRQLFGAGAAATDATGAAVQPPARMDR